MCTSRPACRRCPGSQHGYDVADPARISEDLGGEAAWAEFVAARRAQRSCESCSTSCRITWPPREHNPWWDDVLAHGPFSDFAEYFDIRRPPREPFRVHICTLAQPLWRGAGERRDRAHRSRGRPAARQALRQHLAARARVLGRAARRGGVRASTNSSAARPRCAPSAAERNAYRAAAARAEAVLRRRAARGGSQAAIARVRGGPGAAGCGSAPAILLAARLEACRRADQLPALLRHELAGRHPHGATPSVRGGARAHRDDDRRRARSTGCGVDHPDGLRDPLRAISSGCAHAAGRPNLRREDPRERRAA